MRLLNRTSSGCFPDTRPPILHLSTGTPCIGKNVMSEYDITKLTGRKWQLDTTSTEAGAEFNDNWNQNKSLNLSWDKGLWGGGIRLIVGFQPLMVISPTPSWIRSCMHVYNAWWFNVDMSCLGRTVYARQFLGTKLPIQLRHRGTERKCARTPVLKVHNI